MAKHMLSEVRFANFKNLCRYNVLHCGKQFKCLHNLCLKLIQLQGSRIARQHSKILKLEI